ncbi:MAG: hypothetical protein H0U71_00945 [Gammaproteobacteria bacterium]|nr:hypothetical protein [Gammaproteobacteria bacterium]
MKRLYVLILLLMGTNSYADLCNSTTAFPTAYYPQWFALIYYGKMTNDNLGEVIAFNYSLNKDTLYSLEIGKELNPCNPVRRFLQPIMSSVDFRGNFTVLQDTYGDILEFNPYIAFNWYHFPWRHKFKTTISVGEGISYVTKVPYSEEKNSEEAKKLLNFLLLDLAFGLPSHPEWEIIARIHHRSGAFGLYHANNTGSTAVGLALRYWF